MRHQRQVHRRLHARGRRVHLGVCRSHIGEDCGCYASERPVDFDVATVHALAMGYKRSALIKAKHLRPILCDGDPDMLSQFVRLIVLYEDLRIEVAGSSVDQIQDLDTAGRQYRQMYFVRRAFATLLEMEQALHKLNACKAFKSLRKSFAKDEGRRWNEVVRFFAEHHAFLNRQRNLYGGHFHDDAAAFAVAQVHPDHVGILEITFHPGERYHRPVFKFALELVGLALTADRHEKDAEPFIGESFELLTESMRNATAAVHLIGQVYIYPRFGL